MPKIELELIEVKEDSSAKTFIYKLKEERPTWLQKLKLFTKSLFR